MSRQMNDNFILLSVPQTLFVDLCSDYEANAPCYGGGVGSTPHAQRLPCRGILSAEHATSQAHGT